MITENNFYFTKTSNFICTQIEWEAFWFISDIKQLFLVSKITEDKVKSYTILHNCEFARVGKVNKKLQKKKKKNLQVLPVSWVINDHFHSLFPWSIRRYPLKTI